LTRVEGSFLPAPGIGVREVIRGDRVVSEAPIPSVRTAQGLVVGRGLEAGAEFRGIPYALPPRGELRFAPPRRHGSWSDDASLPGLYFRDAALQFDPVPPFGPLVATRRSSEDCLSLNVWTPDPGPSARLPVMVWLHGGGYTGGSGSDEPYNGRAFVRDGVVLVTVNFRLGVLGYLEVADAFGLSDGSGNFGALDQICALEWVQENIERFGGDPSNVTLFGESAGAWAAATLLAAKRASGLFRRVICQSGGGEHVLRPEEANLIARRYVELLGIKPGDADGLRAVDANRVLAAQGLLFQELADLEHATEILGERAGLLHLMLPVANGEVVTDLPVNLIHGGAGSAITLIAGSNSEENGLHRLWPGGILSAEYMRSLSLMALRKNGADAQAAEASYRSWCNDSLSTAQAMEGDRMFVLPTLDLARAHATAGGETYLYELAYAPTPFGACHVSDVPLVFENLGTPMARTLAGGAGAQKVASLVHTAWVDFARTGTPDPDLKLGWPRHEAGHPASFVIDEACRVDTDREARLRALWAWE